MFKLDNTLIKDKFGATSYNFYSNEEIQKISVKKIINPTAFDHLNNPTNQGLYDKALGVSPFDHHSQIDVYIMCLKLLKAGDVISAANMKQFFLNAAKEIHLLQDASMQDNKKLEKMKNALDNLLRSKDKAKDEKGQDLEKFFHKIQKKFNKMHKQYEEELMSIFSSIVDMESNDSSNEMALPNSTSMQSSIIQKNLKELLHDIWSSVIPTTCPHCHAKSPAIRKDGYTKFFQKPLSEKLKTQIQQQERIQSMVKNSNIREDGFEIITEASTTGNTDSRKESHMGLGEEFNAEEEDEEEEDSIATGKQKFITPMEMKDHIEKMWIKEGQLLNLIFGKYYYAQSQSIVSSSLGPSMFFLENILVPPNRFRPESQGAFGGSGGSSGIDKSYLHAHSQMLTKILQVNLLLKDSLLFQSKNADQVNEKKANEKSQSSEVVQRWISLQDAVNTFVDSSMAQKTQDKEQPGLRQLLERKEGMFRMKMMGKRVNFGARSVISPDPYITTDQIGVPLFMAKKLTFPESVSIVSAERLRKLVINGPKKHPGANIVEDEETGQRIVLEMQTYQQRKGIANMLTVGKKKVYRHLTTGDVLLVNRQPTLHKPSIMAHVARILPKEQTIRMHYANCSTYNADFDGDEMNLHFPQSYLACSEAYKLMATHKQYIIPTSGKPIRGLIQDSVVSGVFLSSKDCFLSKDTYQQLVYVGLRELIEEERIKKIFTLQPAIMKPKVLYTGKQVVSTILKNIVNQELENKQNKVSGLNLDAKSKLSSKEWGAIGAEEGDVIIRDNELLQGTLDKNQFGSSEFGMVHSFYEIYGSEKAGELLTSLARIFTAYLQMHGFTCGLDDLVLTQEYNKKRRVIIEDCHKGGVESAAEFCGLQNYQAKKYNYSNRIVFQNKKNKDKEIAKFTKMSLPEDPFEDKQTIQSTDPVRQKLEEKMNTSDDKQKLDIELDNAIKGKMSAATSEVLKVCIPAGLFKKFPKNNIATMCLTGAKGGLVNMTQITCLLGQQELEGRRVPKMQNGKTLPGNLPHDPNPRSSGYVSDRFISGLRPQDFFFHCMAGREGLIDTAVKTSRSGYLQRCLIKQLESLVVHYDMTVRDNDGSIIQFLYGEDSIDVINTKFLEKFNFLEQNFTSLLTSYKGQEIMDRVDIEKVDLIKHEQKKKLIALKKEQPNVSKKELALLTGDPIISELHPLRYFGAISEKMRDKLENYIKYESQIQLQGKNPLQSKFKHVKGDHFKKMYFLKYMKSIVHPGENVGTIAAQSIGEPSTQMTLNTFHLAGHGGTNMTLGVPRLKEILMTTPTHIKTPNMTVYFKPGIQMSKQKMEAFANKFKRLKLSDVTKAVKVNQSINLNGNSNYERLYTITVEFEDYQKLKEQLSISFKDLIKTFSDEFIPIMMDGILKQLKKQTITNEKGQDELKTIITKTTVPIKKQQKGKQEKGAGKKDKEQENFEEQFLREEEEELNQKSEITNSKKDKNEDEEEDDDEEDEDFNIDIDGFAKKKDQNMMNYQQEDDEDKDFIRHQSHRTSNMNEPEQEDYSQYCSLLREKYKKYHEFIRKIDYKDKEYAQVTIAFPLEFKKVLMLTVVESLLSKVLIRSIKGIERCVFVQDTKIQEGGYLVVQGLNFDAFSKYQDIIDINRLQSNDTWAVKNRYGIEASRQNIVKEVRSVFLMYGIEVNYRHLSLLADFITFNGEYRAFNRIGMEESSSPFLKMSFETTLKYLVQSCLNHDTDDLTTPSSSLVVGNVPKVGTGIFDILVQA